MPYINGKRVTLDEWLAVNGSIPKKLHTGPNGENPGVPATVDEETGSPDAEASKPRRSPGSAKAATAAIADAMGAPPEEVGSGSGDEQHEAAVADADVEAAEKAAKAAEFKAKMAAGRAAAKAKKEQS